MNRVRQQSIFAPLLLFTVLAAGCSDNQPAGPSTTNSPQPDPRIGLLSSCSVAQDSIDAMLPRLFTPGSDRGTSVSTYNQMQKALRKNNDPAAAGYMKQIVDLAFKDFYSNPSKITGGRTAHTAALMMDLVQGLYCLNTGTLLPDFEVPLNGTGAVVTPGTPATVALTDNAGKKRAASQFEANDLPPATGSVPFYVVTITPIAESFTPPEGPLDTQLDQYGPFYEFHVEPRVPFASDVLTGVCINSTGNSGLDERLRLAHNHLATDPLGSGNVQFGNIEIISEAAIDLSPLGLDCTATVSLFQKAASYLLPELLYAVGSPPTTGGKVRTYSPFGAVDPYLLVSANSATSQAGTAGAPVSAAPSVKVQTRLATLMDGVDVGFVPAAGSGTVTGGTQTTSAGIATVGSWTLSSTPGANSLTASPTTAGITYAPVSVSFSATGATPVTPFDWGSTSWSWKQLSSSATLPAETAVAAAVAADTGYSGPVTAALSMVSPPDTYCALYTNGSIGTTVFGQNTVIAARHVFVLPGGATSGTIYFAIDNDMRVFVNGVEQTGNLAGRDGLSGGYWRHDGCAERGDVTLALTGLSPVSNTLVVIAADRGGSPYLDASVTPPSPPVIN
jgi:hypothetical protein